MKRRSASSIIAAVFTAVSCCALGACSDPEPESVKKALAVGGDIAVIDGVELDYDRAFFDGFDNGVKSDNWYIGKQAWGAGGNGGVIPENVNYTDDGVLIFTGNGEYYTSGEVKGVGALKDGTLTGGALISKFLTGPGRYEIKMKVLPRLGACSAFWTFAYEYSTLGNHEIDIELPGGTQFGGDNIGFDRILNTNYRKVEEALSEDSKLSEVTGGKVAAVNDGEWHTFGFDWYSVEPGESVEVNGERPSSTGKVVYYVDGKITAINDVFAPYYQSRLWLGVWFPHLSGFVGDALFDTDYMYVDYVSYIPFKGQPYHDFNPEVNGVADISEYPDKPVSVAARNMISNGDFEYALRGAENSGWLIRESNYSSADYALAVADFNAEYESNKAGYDAAIEASLVSDFAKAHPELSGAALDSAYAAYKASEEYEIDFDAKLSDIRREYIYPDIPPCDVLAGEGARATCGCRISDCGRLSQTVDSIYGGTSVTLSLLAKGNGTVTLRFAASRDGSYISDQKIEIDNSDWGKVTGTFTAPAGTRYVVVQLTSFYKSSVNIDDVVIEVK